MISIFDSDFVFDCQKDNKKMFRSCSDVILKSLISSVKNILKSDWFLLLHLYQRLNYLTKKRSFEVQIRGFLQIIDLQIIEDSNLIRAFEKETADL